MKRFFLLWILLLLLLAGCSAAPEESTVPPPAPLSVSLPSDVVRLAPGGTHQLQPQSNYPLEDRRFYTVSDPSILSVTPRGLVTGLREGTAWVTVHTPSGPKARQLVRVLQPIRSLSLVHDYVKLEPDTTLALPLTLPETATEALVFSSSDPAIATVSPEGIITGHAYGTATISCRSLYSQAAVSCRVKVCDLIQVALTFDDGPSSKHTEKMLDLLAEHNAKGTFFLVGSRIYTCKTAVRRMAAEGHEIGYHTWSHKYLTGMTAQEIKKDYRKFQGVLKSVAGVKPTVFRSPGGKLSGTALGALPVPHILWSGDTKDWLTRKPEAVKDAICKFLKDGAIILLHDIHGSTYTGTKAALEYIEEQDLDIQFVTVTELLSRNGKAPKAHRSYQKG